MRSILLINNEPTSADRGEIVRAAELGLRAPLTNIDALSAKLSEFGEVTVVHHTRLASLAFSADAVFLSGRFMEWDRARVAEHFAAELAFIRQADTPIFGICGGMQLIGLAFGALLVYPGEGHEEFGFLPQTVVERHPLLDGLGGTLCCFEHHRGQLAAVPEGFRLLASREACRVQMLAHGSRPIFGTQFHPELQDETHRDGQRILENFFRLC